ncbi:MAG: cache domain-containing protein, partial [Chloroflexi bacterium]|nr:cache domain-containing protein [Chloroflexota bacterium]
YELAVPALRWHLATNLRLSNLSLLDASGVIRATGLTNTTSIGTANADREWYQNIVATKLPYLGAPTLSRVTQKAVVPFGTPLLGDNGKVIGVLIAGISLDAITDLLTGIGVGPNTSTALVDTRRGGIVLSHPDPLRILTPVNGADPGASQALAGGHGSVEDAGGAGPKTLAAFGTVPGFPWVVITQQPWAVAFEPVESFGRQLLTGVGGALLLAAVAGAGLALQITRPLTRLEQAARRLAGGDLTSRVNFTGRHEIGDLGRAFDVLAEGLEEQRALRERAEETLRESEFRYRMVAELGSDFSYSFRVIPDGALEREWVAGAFQRITGYDPESIAPTAGWGHMIYPEDRRNVAAFFKRTLAGQSDVYEFRMVTASGEVRWLHVASRPEWDEAHTRVERIFGAASDVTERSNWNGRWSTRRGMIR